MKVGKLEIDLNELREFLVKAKKHCYAGNGEKQILTDGSKQLTFKEGNFHYTDNYAGYFQAPGTEIVRWQKEDGQRIWQMSYSGGMNPTNLSNKELAEKTFSFLKEALLQVTFENPFRGPEPSFVKEDFIYRAKTVYAAIPIKKIMRFKGHEEIFLKDQFVFSQDYIGGLVRPE